MNLPAIQENGHLFPGGLISWAEGSITYLRESNSIDFGNLYSLVKLNFCPPTVASYINPPLVIVNVAMPLL